MYIFSIPNEALCLVLNFSVLTNIIRLASEFTVNNILYKRDLGTVNCRSIKVVNSTEAI